MSMKKTVPLVTSDVSPAGNENKISLAVSMQTITPSVNFESNSAQNGEAPSRRKRSRKKIKAFGDLEMTAKTSLKVNTDKTNIELDNSMNDFVDVHSEVKKIKPRTLKGQCEILEVKTTN